MGCPCEYCEQRRKRQPPSADWSWPWFLSVAGLVLALVVFGMCVAFLLGPR